MLLSHEAVQLITIFHRKREIRNQTRNHKTSTKLSSHNQLENIINIENNLLLKKQVDEKSEAFNYAHDTFKLSENKIEVDYISSMSIAKKSRKQLKLRIV